jgi:ubiquinone/menaquinone biosynthesis C-methylase UbiE
MTSRNSVWIFVALLLTLLAVAIFQALAEPAKPPAELQEITARMYRLIAKQIVDDYQVTQGLCLDAGCGRAQLDVELLKITDLQMIGLDIDPEAIVEAREAITKAGVGKRMSLVLGDVQDLPFKDHLFDLIVSRGSYPFWKDRVQGIKELYRVLKPGGVAFVGGGLGKYLPEEDKAKLRAWHAKKLQEDQAAGKNDWKEYSVEDLREVAQKAGIERFELVPDHCAPNRGGWIVIRK